MLARAYQRRAVDIGLFALVVLLRFLGFKVYVDRIRERFGKKLIGPKQMVGFAKELGLRAQFRSPVRPAYECTVTRNCGFARWGLFGSRWCQWRHRAGPRDVIQAGEDCAGAI